MVRDYCDIIWGKAFDVAGVSADSNLRRLESIYYDLDIRELPGSDSPPPEHPAKVSEVPITNQVPPVPVEVPTDSRPDVDQGKEVEAPRARTRARTRVRARPRTPLSLSLNKLLIQGLPRHKFRALVFVIYLFSLFTVFVLLLLLFFC